MILYAFLNRKLRLKTVKAFLVRERDQQTAKHEGVPKTQKHRPDG